MNYAETRHTLRFAIAMALARLSGRFAEWAVLLDVRAFEQMRQRAMERFND